MSDLIDRRAATTIPVMPKKYRHYQTNNLDDAYEQGWDDLQKCIEHLPSAQQWIPCSERLPEEGRQVLVYARSVHFALAKYDEMREADGTYEKQWVTFDAWKPFYKIKRVIAWQPLPEPYRGGKKNV